MRRCPITYEAITDDENYSQRGLHGLSPQLKQLASLEMSAAEQQQEAIARAGKMSVQGVQTKLSAQLKVKEGRFELVDQNGHYILKPPSLHYPELPENEAITMTLAKMIGLEVPVHGLLYAKEKQMTYFIKRFDRAGHRQKFAVEDFAQLLGEDRHTKYDSSMEKVASVITRFCTFPKIELFKLFKLTLFNFLVGNEDMHLKNFSLITRNQMVSLSPAYDLLNTTIAQTNTREELALPLHGKKNNLQFRDFIDYYAKEKLGLNQNVIQEVLEMIQQTLPEWQNKILQSFLSPAMQKKYLDLLETRCQRLHLKTPT